MVIISINWLYIVRATKEKGSETIIRGVTTKFEKASITFDRFHIKQLANKAMDEER